MSNYRLKVQCTDCGTFLPSWLKRYADDTPEEFAKRSIDWTENHEKVCRGHKLFQKHEVSKNAPLGRPLIVADTTIPIPEKE